MRVFITGGKGFIGSRVVKELKKRKHTVHLLSARLGKTSAVEKELKKFKPDCVIHLAWEGLPDIGPIMSARNKSYGLNLFKLIEKYKIPKLICTGTAWEYETERELKAHKHEAFINAKRALRVFGKKIMARQGGIFIWAIPFFVYGNGKKAASLVPSLFVQAKRGETPMPRNPDAWHDFIYVDDVAKAVVLLAEKKVKSGTYDIGTGTLTRTGKIAREVARLYKLPSIKLHSISKKGVRADTHPLKKAITWAPKTNVSKGLRAMLQ